MLYSALSVCKVACTVHVKPPAGLQAQACLFKIQAKLTFAVVSGCSLSLSLVPHCVQAEPRSQACPVPAPLSKTQQERRHFCAQAETQDVQKLTHAVCRLRPEEKALQPAQPAPLSETQTRVCRAEAYTCCVQAEPRGQSCAASSTCPAVQYAAEEASLLLASTSAGGEA